MQLPTCGSGRALRRCSSLAAINLLQQQSSRCDLAHLTLNKPFNGLDDTSRMKTRHLSDVSAEQGAKELLVPVDEIAQAFWEETEWGRAMREQLDDKPFAK
jgi:hypothetical protein